LAANVPLAHLACVFSKNVHLMLPINIDSTGGVHYSQPTAEEPGKRRNTMKTILATALSTLILAGVSTAQSTSNSTATLAGTHVTSIVGIWRNYIAWSCDGPPVQDSTTTVTFNSDGTWSYAYGTGRWIQVEGVAFWNFDSTPGLVYTANVTRNALNGVMGYALAGSNPGSGCFYAVRAESTTPTAPGGKDALKGTN
jgi:hypothetical protein